MICNRQSVCLLASAVIVCIIPVFLWYLHSPISLAAPRWLHSTNREVIESDFWNWGTTFHFHPKHVVLPKNETELVDAVQLYNKVRVVGGGHSFNAQIATRDALIDIRHLNSIHYNVSDGTVRVGAGCKIRHLQHYLVQRGVVVHGFGGGTHYQSIAGAISTNLHGSQQQILAQHIVALGIVLPNATKAVFTAQHPLFHAIKSGMGRLGVIYQVVLRVYPRRCLTIRAEETSLTKALEALRADNVIGEFKVTAWSGTRSKGILHQYQERSTVHPHCAASRYGATSDEDRNYWSAYVSDNWIMAGQVLFPFLTSKKWFYTFFRRKFLDMDGETMGIENGWRYDVAPHYGQLFTEYAIPIENCSHVDSNLFKIAEREGIDLSTLTIRFLRSENGTLLAYANQDSCTIEVYLLPTQYAVPKMLLGVQEFVWMNGGRSHLGKYYIPSKRPIYERQGVESEIERWRHLVNGTDPANRFAVVNLGQNNAHMASFKKMARRAVVFRIFVWLAAVLAWVPLSFLVYLCVHPWNPPSYVAVGQTYDTLRIKSIHTKVS